MINDEIMTRLLQEGEVFKGILANIQTEGNFVGQAALDLQTNVVILKKECEQLVASTTTQQAKMSEMENGIQQKIIEIASQVQIAVAKVQQEVIDGKALIDQLRVDTQAEFDIRKNEGTEEAQNIRGELSKWATKSRMQ